MRRRRRGIQCWCVCDLRKSKHIAEEEKNRSFQPWLAPIRKADQPPFDLLNFIHKHKSTFETTESLTPTRHKVSTLRPNVEEKRIPTGALCQQDLSGFLLTCLFSHHIPLLSCHSPSTVREMLCYCDGSTRELHWHPDYSESEGPNDAELTQHASLISWQRRSIAIWQLNATRPSSKS